MKKCAVVITFLAWSLVVIAPLFLWSKRSKYSKHDAEVRTANFVDEHHCPVYARRPAQQNWSEYEGKLVVSEALTLYDCGQYGGKVIIYASEVQPTGGK